MFYIIIYILLFLAFISYTLKKRRGKMTLFYFSVVLLTVINGLRDPFIYPDNISYFEFFKGDFSAADAGTLNWGYLCFNWLMGFLPHFQFFCFIVAIILTCSYAKLITSYSPYIWFSLILFVLINYLPSFFLLRQYLAMPFVFLSFKYVIERKQLKFLICILLAFSIHSTALVVFPFYYIYGIQYSKRNMLIIVAGTIAASFGFMAIGAIIGSMFTYYSQYMEMEVEEPAWQRALMKGFILLVYLFALRKNFYDDGVNRLIFYSMLMNVIICIGAMNIFGVFRLREYFSLADFIGVPIIWQASTRMRFPKKYLVISMTIVYIVLLFISYESFANGGNMENGYRFFWESNSYPK